jgi:drug/metabolite transporter (DMT)-like permease
MSTITLSTQQQPSKALVIAAFASLYIIWGSTYLAILLALKTIPPFLMAGSRFVIAGLLLYIWCRLRGEKTPPISSVTKISLAGILMLFFGTGTLVWVEQYLPTGVAAIIISTVPLWFVLIDKRNWKMNFSSKSIILGLMIGFAGVVLLFSGKNAFSFAGDKMKMISFIVMLVGSLFWAAGSLYSKYTATEGSTTIKAAIQMLAAGLLFLLVGFVLGEHHNFNFSNISVQSWVSLIYLITMGSLVGYMSYVWLLSVKPPALVGTYAYVNPVVAVFLGWLIVGEPITSQQLMALAIILGGVIMVSFYKDK